MYSLPRCASSSSSLSSESSVSSSSSDSSVTSSGSESHAGESNVNGIDLAPATLARVPFRWLPHAPPSPPSSPKAGSGVLSWQGPVSVYEDFAEGSGASTSGTWKTKWLALTATSLTLHQWEPSPQQSVIPLCDLTTVTVERSNLTSHCLLLEARDRTRRYLAFKDEVELYGWLNDILRERGRIQRRAIALKMKGRPAAIQGPRDNVKATQAEESVRPILQESSANTIPSSYTPRTFLADWLNAISHAPSALYPPSTASPRNGAPLDIPAPPAVPAPHPRGALPVPKTRRSPSAWDAQQAQIMHLRTADQLPPRHGECAEGAEVDIPVPRLTLAGGSLPPPGLQVRRGKASNLRLHKVRDEPTEAGTRRGVTQRRSLVLPSPPRYPPPQVPLRIKAEGAGCLRYRE
ncbi:hypothetical protein DFH06DRAFT_101333 [Mycena polygramma]|nr:hypothetical protein DFH06DRAFT_101333 [Mycena polygramma]